jgi:uncharacterized membrane protein
MIVMTLDHVRGFVSGEQIDPLDLAHTTPALFLTRWITHFCAPNFMFLAGTGAFLYGVRINSKTKLSWFLLTRGLWLVFLELTLVRWAWTFSLDYHFVGGSVLWAIGWSMVALAALVFLPLSAITAIGVFMIGYHNLFDDIMPEHLDHFGWLWAVLHGGQPVELWPTYTFMPQYPLIPWIGVMAVGYALGAMFLLDPRQRRSQLLGLGIVLTAAFVALRYSNLYGNPRPWSAEHESWLNVVFSFIDCHKYPPSLLFLLMTIGPALILLGIFEAVRPPLAWFILAYGRVPLFFYVSHILVAHTLAVVLRTWLPPAQLPAWLHASPGPQADGYGLPMVYLMWIVTLLILLLPCIGFGRLKAQRRAAWLSYL